MNKGFFEPFRLLVRPTASFQPPMPDASDAADRTFEDTLERLEDIVDTLEDDPPSLDEALDAYEEGVALANECLDRLEEAEQRVSELSID
ncbi:exodeoxyribonuclease VII, small subunit [Salinibacter ruber DSM 13855]|uniref:Exodeoxyribonuclease 7 small subunit n=2 Tax=Salinibacter ruber TaxID=146919 RepID=Q2S4K8_SALRD|nr:exodeoxyribonuclease VII, small subunit [Salinibacter ruber DSM 13855]